MPSTLPGSILQFGPFELDCGRFELRRKGHALRIERKPMELLILLASRDGQLVTRVEIAQRLWSTEVFVDTEHGINTAIRKLRYLLRDDPNDPQFIQTVTGMGYRFIAPVAAVEANVPIEVVPELAPTVIAPSQRRTLRWYLTGTACLAFALGGILLYELRHRAPEIEYTQLTEFTDSSVGPALSPDGHMLAFFRSSYSFFTPDPIYVKMLPNGEAKRVTDDSRPKYGLAFSPDGSQIAYTVLEHTGFSTYEVSALGGEPHLLLKNAAGLVWLDPQQFLFSEIRSGIHLGVVTESATGTGLREIYFPAHERGMAHYSFPSPDRRWALVVEMDGNGDWAPCRLVALEGKTESKTVGPAGACTAAGWSPDGSRMYFTARLQGRSHLWRQRFPDGKPEQITSGPTEEDGLAVEADGRSLITSIGVHESAIWIHDGSGDRQLSSEGEVVGYSSTFSPDSTFLYYLLRRGKDSTAELWRTRVDTGKSESVFSGISIIEFALSTDGKQVVYTTAASGGSTRLWVAPVDRSSPATKVDVSGARSPQFGVHGQILFQHTEGNTNYLEQIDADGTHRAKALPYPILDFNGISPSRRWVLTSLPKTPANNLPAVTIIPLDGGPPRRICADYCAARWSTDGRFLIVAVEDPSRTSPGRSLAIPLGPDESPPKLPEDGIAPSAEASIIPGAVSVGRGELVAGKDPDHYAWVNTTVHRNLYQISLH